jgi:hypothetical protein
MPQIEGAGAHLEEQRRDEEEVVAAHQDELDIRPPPAELFQVAGGVDPREATAEDDDACLPRLGCSTGRCTVVIGCQRQRRVSSPEGVTSRGDKSDLLATTPKRQLRLLDRAGRRLGRMLRHRTGATPSDRVPALAARIEGVLGVIDGLRTR